MLSTVRKSSKFNKGLALSAFLPNVLAKNINCTVWFSFTWIFLICVLYTLNFKAKFPCNSNLIQYFKIVNAIPDPLRLKARKIGSVSNQFFTSNLFRFNRNFTFSLDKGKSKDFYDHLIDKTRNGGQTGPKRITFFAKKQN